MDVFFQSYTCLIYSKCSEQLSDFVLYCKLIHTREPWYQVSVRQARSLPKTSFRLHLAMNTLVVGWTLPAVRARWGLAPVRIRSCWANNKMRVCQNKVIGTSSFFFVSFFKKASSRPFWIDFSFDSILIAYHLIKRCFQSNFPVIKAL